MNRNLKFLLLAQIRRYWIVIAVTLLATLAVLPGASAWAAAGNEVRQTVPPPTPKPVDTPIPQVTPTPEPPPQPPQPEPTQPQDGGGQVPAPVQPTTTSTPADGKLRAKVAVLSLNVRNGPGTGYLVIGKLVRDQQVEVLERNEKGDWWRVCCLPNSDLRGWINAQFVLPEFDLAQAQTLLPLASDIPAPPTPTATVPPTPTSAQAVQTQTVASAVTLDLRIEQTPTFPYQGQVVSLRFVVTNPTDKELTQIELRDELPTGLGYIRATADNGGRIFQDVTENNREVFSIFWSKIPASGSVSATVMLTIDSKLANGSVLDNLAFVGAENLAGMTAGVSIGMPPVELPDFQ